MPCRRGKAWQGTKCGVAAVRPEDKSGGHFAVTVCFHAFFSELRVEKDEFTGKKRTRTHNRVAKLSSFPSCELPVAKKDEFFGLILLAITQ